MVVKTIEYSYVEMLDFRINGISSIEYVPPTVIVPPIFRSEKDLGLGLGFRIASITSTKSWPKSEEQQCEDDMMLHDLLKDVVNPCMRCRGVRSGAE